MSMTLNLVDRLLARGRHFQQLGRDHDAIDTLGRLSQFASLPAEVAEETQARLAEINLRCNRPRNPDEWQDDRFGIWTICPRASQVVRFLLPAKLLKLKIVPQLLVAVVAGMAEARDAQSRARFVGSPK